MNNIHYLDHASTSYPTKYFAKDYYIPGNANSSHALGLQTNQALNEARQRIMDCLGVRSGKVLFCRCACEPGIGAIWLSDRLFKFLGGDEDSRNEYGLIHGNPNVSAAVAMSYAMEHAIDGLEDGNDEHWRPILWYN